MARRIAFINEKGGTCKTTLAVNVAAHLAEFQHRRVLLVDMDSQGHAGKTLGLDVARLSPTIHDVLTRGGVQLTDAIMRTSVPRLDIVVANKALAEFPVLVAGDPSRELRLHRRLAAIDAAYDYVIVDSPPAAGLASTNVLLAVHDVVIPVSVSYLAMEGCAEMVESVERARAAHGRPVPRVSLVVPTLYRGTQLADEIVRTLQRHFPEQVTSTIVAYNVKIDEAQSHSVTIFQYAPTSRAALSLDMLAREIGARLPPFATAASGSPATPGAPSTRPAA